MLSPSLRGIGICALAPRTGIFSQVLPPQVLLTLRFKIRIKTSTQGLLGGAVG